MTVGWFIFGVVMPVVVVALGLIAAWANDRYLRREDEKTKKAAE